MLGEQPETTLKAIERDRIGRMIFTEPKHLPDRAAIEIEAHHVAHHQPIARMQRRLGQPQRAAVRFHDLGDGRAARWVTTPGPVQIVRRRKS